MTGDWKDGGGKSQRRVALRRRVEGGAGGEGGRQEKTQMGVKS